MIELKNFSVYASKKKIVHELNVNFSLNAIHAIIGPNGCGKTSLFKGLCGLYKFDGEFFFNSQRLDLYNQKQDLLAAFLEGGSYYLNMTVCENLKYACLLNEIDLKKINETLALVNFPNTHHHTKASKLSLGQRQKLGLAMTLILEKPILLLDEPLNSLDIDAVEDFNELLLKIKTETNTTILITSHLIEKLLDITDSVCILKDGYLKHKFDTKEIGSIYFIKSKESFLLNMLEQKKINYNTTKNGLLIYTADHILTDLLATAEITNLAPLAVNIEDIYKHCTA